MGYDASDAIKCASVAQVKAVEDRVKWLEDTAFKGRYDRELGEEWIAWGNKHGFFYTGRADEWFANNHEVRDGLEKRVIKAEAEKEKLRGSVLLLESDLRSAKDCADTYKRSYDRAQEKAIRQAAEICRLLAQVDELKKNPLVLMDQTVLQNYRHVAEALNLNGPGAIRDYVRGLEDEIHDLNDTNARLEQHLMECSGGEW